MVGFKIGACVKNFFSFIQSLAERAECDTCRYANRKLRTQQTISILARLLDSQSVMSSRLSLSH